MTPAPFAIRPPATDAEFAACYALRYQILREPLGQPPGSERDPLDAGAYHLMAVTPAGEVIGAGRLHLAGPGTGQIRFMAVAPAWRGRGVGRAILAGLEARAREWGLASLALNARDRAVDFYLAAGFHVVGEGPTMFGTLKHKAMAKALSPPSSA